MKLDTDPTFHVIEYFGRQPKRRMSLAVSDPALSSKAHQSNHRTVRKLRIPDSGDELVDGTERNSLEVHQKAQKARRRALREWKRKREAANRDVTKDMLGHNKRFVLFLCIISLYKVHNMYIN